MSDAKINDGGPAFPQHEKLKMERPSHHRWHNTCEVDYCECYD